jgi:hypothetical protein
LSSSDTSVQRVTRAADWRLIYANAVGIGFGPGEARLTFGFDQNPAASGTDVLEQTTVILPHSAAKVLVYSLNAIISNYEALNGPIPVPQDKLQEIDRQVKTQAAVATPPKP